MTAFPIFYAVIENDLRRVLTYSMINQLGFMVVGVGIGTELALNGTAAHAFAHILYKALLFMSMGAVLLRTRPHHRLGLGRTLQIDAVYRGFLHDWRCIDFCLPPVQWLCYEIDDHGGSRPRRLHPGMAGVTVRICRCVSPFRHQDPLLCFFAHDSGHTLQGSTCQHVVRHGPCCSTLHRHRGLPATPVCAAALSDQLPALHADTRNHPASVAVLLGTRLYLARATGSLPS